MDKFTHTGYIVGVDARTPDGYKRKSLFRETPKMWVSKTGERFNKMHGYLIGGGAFPMYGLDLSSMKRNSDD